MQAHMFALRSSSPMDHDSWFIVYFVVYHVYIVFMRLKLDPKIHENENNIIKLFYQKLRTRNRREASLSNVCCKLSLYKVIQVRFKFQLIAVLFSFRAKHHLTWFKMIT